MDEQRRKTMGWLAAGALSPWLAGCASPMRQATGARAGQLSLLYYADTLDARQPGWPVVPRIRLGAASRIGTPPWLTGPDALAAAGHPDPHIAALLDASQTPEERYGGYATLGARLERLRRELGSDNTLTLENGQCWNGSGLAHLSGGQSGPAGSALLGAEARVSSDERLLWGAACPGLYRQFGGAVLGADLAPARREGLGVRSHALFERGGVKVAVLGIADPYAADQPGRLAEWYSRLLPQLDEARSAADLLVVMADVGSGAGLWLAERLPQADLLLCARGQDFWPRLIQVPRQAGGTLPVCLAGTRGQGVFELTCQGSAAGWRFEARFHPALASTLSADERIRAAQLQRQLDAARAPHASWLDQGLLRAPQDLWRRDLLGGSWDALIAAALGEGFDGPVLLPGLRYDLPLRRGEWITREHLLALTGGHPARVVEARSSAEELARVLEQAADARFGDPLLLDDSRDLPRLSGAQWSCRYGASGGQRVSLQAASLQQTRLCRSIALDGQGDGEPLWQRLEADLLTRGPEWRPAPLALPQMRFVEGHPGWHPLQEALA